MVESARLRRRIEFESIRTIFQCNVNNLINVRAFLIFHVNFITLPHGEQVMQKASTRHPNELFAYVISNLQTA